MLSQTNKQLAAVLYLMGGHESSSATFWQESIVPQMSNYFLNAFAGE